MVVERRTKAVQKGDAAEPRAGGCGGDGVTRAACRSAEQSLDLNGTRPAQPAAAQVQTPPVTITQQRLQASEALGTSRSANQAIFGPAAQPLDGCFSLDQS